MHLVFPVGVRSSLYLVASHLYENLVASRRPGVSQSLSASGGSVVLDILVACLRPGLCEILVGSRSPGLLQTFVASRRPGLMETLVASRRPCSRSVCDSGCIASNQPVYDPRYMS